MRNVARALNEPSVLKRERVLRVENKLSCPGQAGEASGSAGLRLFRANRRRELKPRVVSRRGVLRSVALKSEMLLASRESRQDSVRAPSGFLMRVLIVNEKKNSRFPTMQLAACRH